MNIKKVILLLSLTMMVVAVAAQPGGDPNGGGKPGAPISGIELLMLGGGLFGAIKSYFKFKSRKPGT